MFVLSRPETDINDTVKEIRTALLDADVALAVANSFSEKIKEKALGVEVSQSLNPAQQVVKIVHQELVNIFTLIFLRVYTGFIFFI